MNQITEEIASDLSAHDRAAIDAAWLAHKRMPACDCGAREAEGKWAGVHTPGCAVLTDPHRKLRDVLREHWLTRIECDHATRTDRPVCACSLWRCDPMPNVGAAVEAWIDHVCEQMA